MSRRAASGFVLLCGLVAGCKKHPVETPAVPSAAPAPAAVVKAEPRCTAVKSGSVFTVGDPGKRAVVEDGGDDEVALPFAVDVGSAVGYAGGFAVPALRSVGSSTHAVVALVGADAASGRLVELGQVSAGAEPPQLVARGRRIIGGVPGSDAGGATLRLLAVDDSGDKPDVKWGAELKQGRDDSQVFGVALGDKRGILVWDEWDKSAKHGVIRASSFSIDDIGNATRAKDVSPKDDDAEAPRVVRRPGGFWIAWISHSGDGKRDDDAGEGVVELGHRWLELSALDDNGAPTGAPTLVTARTAHVLVFDLAPASDGGALLGWRDDETAPGAETRVVRIARVATNGAIDASAIDDDKVGAGVPSLLVDDEPLKADKQSAWLALAGISDATRVAALGADRRVLDRVGTDPLLRRADVLAIHAGHMLLADPRGLAMDLSVVTCQVGKPLPPEPDGGSPDNGEP